MQYSNAMNTQYMNQMPFQIRFDGCLKDPIVHKCHSLTQLIHESMTTNLKDIQMNYSTLVEDIFGVGNHSMSSDWSLKVISRNYNTREFDAIYAFLDINGPLFQLIRQLMNDPMNRYDFSKKYLPIPTKLSLEESIVPTLYANKISNALSTNISVNAFEFFIFHFSYLVLNNSPNHYSHQNQYYLELMSNANTIPSNIIYFALLESYLNYLVPLSSVPPSVTQNPTSQSSIWQSLSSTTSNFLHLSSPTINALSPKPMTSTPKTPTLIKSSILNLKPLLTGGHEPYSSDQWSNRSAHDSLGSEIVRCETFLLIITDMWLNHAIQHNVAKRQGSPLKQQMFTPNSDHMRAVRIMIKHLHYFANSCPKRNNDVMDSPINELKRTLWSQKYVFQRRLYTFFRLSFDRWPNDTSFRLPLETWISYIQPWRYTNVSKADQSDNDEKDGNTRDVTLSDQQWKEFISDNLMFYSIIFRQLIPRFSRVLDLSSSKNALMLFRLTKVFSQQNFALWIREAENSLMTNESLTTNLLHTSWSQSSRATLLSPTLRQQNMSSLGGPLRHHLLELELNPNEFTPLFCPAIKPLILQLINEIKKALNLLSEVIGNTEMNDTLNNPVNQTFFQYMTSFFQMSENANSEENTRLMNEKRKTRNHLQMSSTQLESLFEMPANESAFLTQVNGNNAEETRLHHRTQALYEESNGTPKLTSFGRNQVLNKQCKPELNVIEGNPDRQPVRSYELYYLVYILLFITDWINLKFGRTIQKLYNMSGFMGIFCRQVITGPTTYIKIVKSGTAYRPPDRVTEVLNARINLRFMANKVYLIYTMFVLFLVYIFNYSFLSFSSLMLAMYLTYLATKTVLYYISSR
ncbi:sphingomyelin phosphodiesterase 4-like [Oppia nitens]|uniref:sphingomyelin phosphodiesterase 4-like n=1 Tax=Oppia nitens TaxID=1686743 RepID=UPI0023DC4662|nr:sphingomyelin phosphodiesterase 4-like [Oppia nitens]